MMLERLPSKVLHPLIVLPLSGILLLYSRNLSLGNIVTWVLTYILTALVPTTLTAWRTGDKGLDVISRSQRNKSYLVGITSMCLTLLAAYYISAPEAVVRLGGFAVISSIIFGVANHFSKVSIHTGAITFAAGAFTTEIPTLTFTGLLLTVPVGWSRVKLDCHTKGQVIQGGILGLACGLAASFI